MDGIGGRGVDWASQTGAAEWGNYHDQAANAQGRVTTLNQLSKPQLDSENTLQSLNSTTYQGIDAQAHANRLGRMAGNIGHKQAMAQKLDSIGKVAEGGILANIGENVQNVAKILKNSAKSVGELIG